jgi:hypothetical protein
MNRWTIRKITSEIGSGRSNSIVSGVSTAKALLARLGFRDHVESLNLVNEFSGVAPTSRDLILFSTSLLLGADSLRLARRNDCMAWDRTTWEYAALAAAGRSVIVMNSSCNGLPPDSDGALQSWSLALSDLLSVCLEASNDILTAE